MMLDPLLNHLQALGYVASTPVSHVMGALQGNPFERSSGAEVLDSYGLADSSTTGGKAAGMGLDAVLDPVNLLTFGGGAAAGAGLAWLVSRLGRKAAQEAPELVDDAARLAMGGLDDIPPGIAPEAPYVPASAGSPELGSFVQEGLPIAPDGILGPLESPPVPRLPEPPQAAPPAATHPGILPPDAGEIAARQAADWADQQAWIREAGMEGGRAVERAMKAGNLGEARAAAGKLARLPKEVAAGMAEGLRLDASGTKTQLIQRIMQHIESRGVPPAKAAVAHAEFAIGNALVQRFDKAWAQLDSGAGGHNFVSIASLREAMPELSREEFDALLAHLRKEQRYGLAANESYSGISEAQRAASIADPDNPGMSLGWVVRKDRKSPGVGVPAAADVSASLRSVGRGSKAVADLAGLRQKVEAAYASMSKEQFAAWSKEAGLTVSGTKGAMLKQWRDVLAKLQVSAVQTDF